MANYKGKIRVKGNPTAVSFNLEAGNPSEAMKIVKSQFNITKILKQPTRY